MNRRFCWAMLVAAGTVLGCALSGYRTDAALPAPLNAAADEQVADIANQVKDIQSQVKAINTLLQSGTLRVVVVINPDAKH
jgi:hypothetical protein